MSTASKNACTGGLVGVALVIIAIIAVLAASSRHAPMSTPSASATTAGSSPVSNKTISSQSNPAPATDRLAKLAEAGIDIDTLAVLQECRKGWQNQPSKAPNALASKTPPNPN
jgi:hypothetical protein